MIDLAVPYHTTNPAETKGEMLLLYEILEWLMTQIHDSTFLKTGYEGNISFNDIEHQKWRAMIMGHNRGEEEAILEILQQPPPNYRGKYIACIVAGEPEGVKEQTEAEQRKKEGEEEGVDMSAPAPLASEEAAG